MSRALRIYVWLVSVVGIGAVAVAAAFGNLEGLALRSDNLVADVAFFVIMGCLLDMMIVPMARGGAVSAGFAIFFACMLILGPYVAAFVAVLATLWTDVIVRRGIPLYRTLFNVGHSGLSVLAAGGAYYLLLGGAIGDVRLNDLGGVARIVGSAAVLFGIEVTAVNLAVALERRAPLRSVWVGNARLVLPLDAALAGVGLLVAMIYEHRRALFGGYGWVFIGTIVILPTALLYYGSRLYMDMYRVYEKTLRTLIALKESRIYANGQEGIGHGERVAELASGAADEAGLSPEEVRNVRYAGYLHDLGQVATPARNDVSEQPSPWRERHSEIGYHILRQVGFLQGVATLVRHHDRRFDEGPFGSDGEEILFGARLLAAAERYDELTDSAKAPLSAQDAVQRLIEESGARFDPQAVRAVIRRLARQARVDAVQCEEALHAI